MTAEQISLKSVEKHLARQTPQYDRAFEAKAFPSTVSVE